MKALSGQTPIDLAVQTAGVAEAAILIAIANNVSLTDDLSVGSSLADIAVQNSNIATYYANKGLKPATAIASTSSSSSSGLAGIEYWIIETDFVVS